jgi:hypothetical protein
MKLYIIALVALLVGAASVHATNVTYRVFVTNNTWTGNIGGLSGADAKCMLAANAARLNGTWMAWLSSNSTSASSRLYHYTTGVYRLDGIKVANNWNDLTDGTLLAPINITERRQVVQSPKVWTGTNTTGAKYAPFCGNWASASGNGTIGNAFRKDYRWTVEGKEACSGTKHLYCFEQPTPAVNAVAN